MAASRYRRFLKLCEEWPVDETKRGRDLGAYLRQRVAQAFREGENTQVIRLWGPPAAGRRSGRGERKPKRGGATSGRRLACACARFCCPGARAREPPNARGPAESGDPGCCWALSRLHFAGS